MFDTTVFNRIALHLAEIAAQLKKANELKEAELNRCTIYERNPAPVYKPSPAPNPHHVWPPRFGDPHQPPYTITSEANR